MIIPRSERQNVFNFCFEKFSYLFIVERNLKVLTFELQAVEKQFQEKKVIKGYY